MKTESFIIPNLTGLPSIVIAAMDKRDELVLHSATIRRINSNDEAAAAKKAIDALAVFHKAIESQRKAAKAPFLATGKEIDALADTLSIAVKDEDTRLNKLLGQFIQEQRRLQAEAEQKARDEERRIMLEAEEKARKAVESGKNVDAKLEKIDAKTFQAVAETRAAVANVAPQIDVTLRVTPKFEITDIAALYAARPELVKLEVNTAMMNSLLRAAPKIILPGVRHWTEAKAS